MGALLLSDERERWLIQPTRELVTAVGAEPLLFARMLEPTPRFFPEGWEPDLEAATIISRRLLDFAGLQPLELEMVAFVNEAPVDPEEHDGRHVVGFFRGIEESVCQFGIHVPALEDPEYLVGVMAHEVAHGAVLGLGALLGAVSGLVATKYHCSNAACEALLPDANANECPSCKGYVLGTLRKPSARVPLSARRSSAESATAPRRMLAGGYSWPAPRACS